MLLIGLVHDRQTEDATAHPHGLRARLTVSDRTRHSLASTDVPRVNCAIRSQMRDGP